MTSDIESDSTEGGKGVNFMLAHASTELIKKPIPKGVSKSDLAEFAYKYTEYINEWAGANTNQNPGTVYSCFTMPSNRVRPHLVT